ncbi:hypothetical protein V2J09_024074 [Rumex salicifolius]
MTSAISQGPHNVFVYGSLLSDDVVSALLKRVPCSSPALLNGYQRFSIKERVYPAILPVEGKQVDGRVACLLLINMLFSLLIDSKVLMGLTVPELDILDVFEDVEYFRDLVEVSLVENTEKIKAFTYVWDDKDDPNLYGDWNFEEWKQLHLSDFLKMTKDFVEEFEQPDAKTRVETYQSHYK